MTHDEQRIAIAKACGWTDIRRQRLWAGDQDLWGTKLIGGEKHRNRLPDYLNDLNAMHKAMQVLVDKGLMWQFANQIIGIICSAKGLSLQTLEQQDYLIFLASSTAELEAEAFLRTLGLWQESNTQPQ